MCLLGIAALVADVGLYAAASAATSEASDAAIKRQADVIGSGLRISAAGATFNGGPLPTVAADGISTDAAVIDQSGLLTSPPNNPLRPITLENLATPVLRTNGSIWVDLTDANHIQRRVFVTLVAGMDPRTALLVERSVEVQTSSLWITRVLLTILSIAFVALGGLLAYWQAGRVLRPVRDIAGLARSLSERDLHRRVDIAVPDDELGELVRTFNGMLGRLEASFTTMNGFIADASHELRGPLTKMRSEIELAIDRPGSKSDLERVLSLILVHASGPRGDAARRHRTQLQHVALKMGPYQVRGFLHALPGADPVAAMRRRKPMVPLTNVRIEFTFNGETREDRVETVIVNREQIDWVEVVEPDRVEFPVRSKPLSASRPKAT